MNAKLITSQSYIDQDIVQAKRAARDYAVTISPAFEVDGELYAVVIDGHHSYAAAIADGVKPAITVATAATDDRILLLDESVDAYLEASYIDDAWHYVATGRRCF